MIENYIKTLEVDVDEVTNNKFNIIDDTGDGFAVGNKEDGL